MIKTYSMLVKDQKKYQFPADKILRMITEGKHINLTKGLYETNPSILGRLVANAIFNPTYLSFEFAIPYGLSKAYFF